MGVRDAFEAGRKFVANPQGESPTPAQGRQASNSGGASGGAGNEDLRGRSRLNPNGDINAPQSGGVNSAGNAISGGGTVVSGNSDGAGNDAITTARTRRDQAAVNNPFRENGYYAKIFRETTPFRPPTMEELRRSQRRERSQKIVSAIGDGISSLANLYFTTQYAPNAYNPQMSLSAASAKRWEQLRKDRQANTEQYIQGLMTAEARDDANTTDRRNYEWNIYNTQAREAENDREFAYRQEQAGLDRAAAAAAAAEDARRWDAEQARKDREAQERSRHNRAMEGIARARAARSGGSGGRKGGVTLRSSGDASLTIPDDVWKNDNFINEFWERNIKGRNDWNGGGVPGIIRSTDDEAANVNFSSSESGAGKTLAERRRQTLMYLMSGESGYDEEDINTLYGMFDDIDNVYN